MLKAIRTDGRDVFWEGDVYQVMAVLKGVGANVYDGVGDVDGGYRMAISKGTVANNCERTT